MAQARRDRLCLLERQLERAQPRAPLDAEQVRHRRAPTSRRTSTAWISFFARERARTSCSRRASRRRNTRVCSSGDHTASSSPAASSRASARASSRSVFARAWRIPVSAGLTTTTRATCGSMIRAISHALPVTSNATRSAGARLARTTRAPPASSRSDPQNAARRPRRSRPRRNRGARRARSPFRPLSPPSLLHSRNEPENQRANDKDRYVLAAHPGKSQGRPPSKHELEAHRPQTACPTAFSQKAPVPVDRP